MIDVRDFTRFIDGLPQCTVDVMLEAKAKGKDGGFFSGTLAQIKDDIAAVKDFEQMS